MRELVRRKPALTFSVFIVAWTWIVMAVIIALVPVDPVEGPQFVHVALVFFVASPSVFGFLFTRLADGKNGVRELIARAGQWRGYRRAEGDDGEWLVRCPAVGHGRDLQDLRREL